MADSTLTEYRHHRAWKDWIGLFRSHAVEKQNINLVCVAERIETPVKAQATGAGIKIAMLDEIIIMGDGIDIFDRTGSPNVRKELREKLQASNNKHTVIASETIARLIWSLISNAVLPLIANLPPSKLKNSRRRSRLPTWMTQEIRSLVTHGCFQDAPWSVR